MNHGTWSVILTAALLAGAAGSVKAQLVKVPAPPCIWTVSYAYTQPPPIRPQDPAEARTFDRMQLIMGHIKLKTVYATAQARRDVILWTIGRTTENWFVDGYLLYSALNFPVGTVSYLQPDKSVTHPTDFPELQWLGQDCFAGKESYQGTMANHYVFPPPKKPGLGNPAATTSANGNSSTGAQSQKMEAWINAKTGFPLYMENADMRITYTLQKTAPTDSDMKMPPAYQKVWDSLNVKP